MAKELENGDQIDIITKSTARPLAEWENFVKTGAKSGIRRAVRAERAVEFSRVGKSILQKAFSEVNKPLKKRAMDKIPQIFGVQKPEDLFALVGEGRMQPELVIKKMFPDLAKSKKRVRPTGETDLARSKSREPLALQSLLDLALFLKVSQSCSLILLRASRHLH